MPFYYALEDAHDTRQERGGDSSKLTYCRDEPRRQVKTRKLAAKREHIREHGLKRYNPTFLYL
jgi:hypothetical protein